MIFMHTNFWTVMTSTKNETTMPFFALEKLSALHEGYKKAFNIDGNAILLLHTHNKTMAIRNVCPHMDVPLETGELTKQGIRCRAHGIEFDLKTGKAIGPLADTLSCLKQYPIIFEGTKVGVDLP